MSNENLVAVLEEIRDTQLEQMKGHAESFAMQKEQFAMAKMQFNKEIILYPLPTISPNPRTFRNNLFSLAFWLFGSHTTFVGLPFPCKLSFIWFIGRTENLTMSYEQ